MFYKTYHEYLEIGLTSKNICYSCYGVGTLSRYDHIGLHEIDCIICDGKGKIENPHNFDDYTKAITKLMQEKVSYLGLNVFDEACEVFNFINNQEIQ